MNNTRAALAILIEDAPSVRILDSVRSKYDRAYSRWMPHINIFFPFVSEDELPAVATALERGLKQVAPFRLCLDSFSSFSQRHGATVHLHPTSKESIKNMQNLYRHTCAALPCHKPPRTQFRPHLTLGQWRTLSDALPILKDSMGEFELELEVHSLCLITRPADGPFTVWKRIPLGQSEGKVAMEQVLMVNQDSTEAAEE